jgi:hypothetical protein
MIYVSFHNKYSPISRQAYSLCMILKRATFSFIFHTGIRSHITEYFDINVQIYGFIGAVYVFVLPYSVPLL